MGSSFNMCMGGDMCINVAGLVGQITVTGGCCLNGDEMMAYMLGASGISR